MSTPSSMPDPKKIDAWLAGDLPDDEAADLELWVEENGLPDEMDESAEDGLLHDLPETRPEISALVEMVKTHHPLTPTPRNHDTWTEILTPSKNSNILGTLGDYEVLKVIAKGGMGILLKARDPELDRIAALKILSPGLASNATARERFLREARAAAALEHENILPIYGIHAEAIPWFSMRYIGGGSLQNALDEKRTLTLETLKSIARQTAAALQAAHDAGIIHRDVKPGNILLDEDGKKVWVCDFGIARSTEAPELTYAGSIAGTPQYMSPEQADGRRLDGRSDLFSLGTLLYRCATGQPAFEGNTSASVLQNISTTDPALATKVNTRLPKWFERMLSNLLAKDPRDRFSKATDVIRAIDAEHSPPPKHRVRQRRRLFAACASFIAIILLLQIPAVRNVTNKGIAALFDRNFLIDGSLGAHKTLPYAVASAKDGDTILLPSGDPIPVDKLQIPAGKSLTFQPASDGPPPVLTTNIAGAPGIETHSPLHFRGIGFKINPKRDSDGIIKVFDTTVRIENCRFTARREMQNPYDDVKSRAIDLHGKSSIDIENCDFDLDQTNCLTFIGGETALSNTDFTASAKISKTRIDSFYGINLYDFQTAGHRVNVTISDSQFTGEFFLKHSRPGQFPSLTCRAERTQFFTANYIAWFQNFSKEIVLQRFQWQGSDNSHFPDKYKIIGGSRKSPVTIPLAEFPAAPGLPQPGGYVVIQGTDERITSLKAAIELAPNDATLFIHGELHCEETIFANDESRINLVGAPDTEAIIATIHPTEHALFMRGSHTIKNITFRRHNPARGMLPILGFLRGDRVLVENCRFDSISKVSLYSTALSFTDTQSAVVRNCVFDAPGANAIFLAHADYAEKSIQLVVEDSLFVAKTAFYSRARSQVTGDSIEMRRCIALCDHFYTKSPNNSFLPIEFTISDSTLDIDKHLFSLPESRALDLKAGLNWSGISNIYPPSLKYLNAPPLVADSFDAFQAAVQSASETSPTRAAIFERSTLNSPITPQKLLNALSKDISSPAIEMLRNMSKESKE